MFSTTCENRNQDHKAEFRDPSWATSLHCLFHSLMSPSFLHSAYIFFFALESIEYEAPLSNDSPTLFPHRAPLLSLRCLVCTLLMPRDHEGQFWSHQREKPLLKFDRRHPFLNLFPELTSCRLQWNFVQQYIILHRAEKLKPKKIAIFFFFLIRIHWDVQGWSFGLRNSHLLLFIVL